MTTLEFCEKSMKLLACSQWDGCCSLIRLPHLTFMGHRTLDAAVHPWRMAGYDSSIYSKVDVFSLVLLLRCSSLSGREFDLYCLFDPCSLYSRSFIGISISILCLTGCVWEHLRCVGSKASLLVLALHLDVIHPALTFVNPERVCHDAQFDNHSQPRSLMLCGGHSEIE